jgi:hypothetical protein
VPHDHNADLNPFDAQQQAQVDCPWCGESIAIALDPGGGPVQSYVEDCSVCCRPMSIRLRFAADGSAMVDAGTDDA